jgi:hypothetical protein
VGADPGLRGRHRVDDPAVGRRGASWTLAITWRPSAAFPDAPLTTGVGLTEARRLLRFWTAQERAGNGRLTAGPAGEG